MTHLIQFVRSSPDYSLGRSDAEREIALGNLGYQDFGAQSAWWEEFASALRKRYQIDYDFIVVTNGGAVARSIGYNERMVEEITSKFGSDVVETTRNEVARMHRE